MNKKNELLKELKEYPEDDVVRAELKGRLDREKELKTEAIKEIKAIRNKEFLIDNVETYIRWKFNLTEEDLKDGA